MRIAFATAQSLQGSTNVGRVLPVATEMANLGHECHILTLAASPSPALWEKLHIHTIGTEPFRRTPRGKERVRGLGLVFNMLATAFKTAWTLRRLRPEVVILSKPLPANTLGVWLYSLITTNHKVVLDADDFELTANKLTSITQRAVIHWSERKASALAQKIVVASPFLADHFEQLTQNGKPIEIIPTGIKAAGGATGVPRPLEQPHPPTILAYLGSVSVSSGHRVDLLPDILEQARVHNPNIHLLIAGDGDDVATLKEEFISRDLADAVTWHGRFALSDVEGLLTPQTILLDPVDDSIANRAKSSSRVLLAASAGLPLVTSNIGIRPELLPVQFHGRFFADPGDPGSYVAKIKELAEHPLTPAEQHELVEHSQRYHWDKLAARYCDILI